MTREPKRLIETEADALGAALGAARRQVASSKDLTELASRLSRAGVVLPPPADAATQSGEQAAPKLEASPQQWSPVLKASLAGLAVGLGLLGGSLLVKSSPKLSSHSVVESPREQTTQLEPQAAPSFQAPFAAPSAGRRPEPTSTSTSTSTSTPIPTPSTVPPEVAPGAEPLADRQAAPARTGRAVPAVSASTPASHGAASSAILEAPAPRDQKAARSNDPPVASETDPSATPSSKVGTVETELELLKRARAALSADPARAVAITERCAQLYPRAKFSQERDFIAISALIRLGRLHESSSRASTFRAQYPRSAYLPQLKRMLGE